MPIIEDESNSPLYMDRSLPLGNSVDTFSRRALHVKIGNGLVNPVPVVVVSGGGTGYFIDAKTVTTPGTEQTIFTQTLTQDISLMKLNVSCSMSCQFFLRLNGAIIGSGRTRPSEHNISFDWTPGRPAIIGNVLELKLEAFSPAPAVSVEAYLMASV